MKRRNHLCIWSFKIGRLSGATVYILKGWELAVVLCIKVLVVKLFVAFVRHIVANVTGFTNTEVVEEVFALNTSQ